MTNQRSLGLVVEGNVTSSSVLRLPGLAEELGPVKAGSLRVARRLSNYLRAGYGVGNYEDLQGVRMVFLRVPDESISRIVSEVCASELSLKDVIFVLCESFVSSRALLSLQIRGASIATLWPVPSLRKSWFVAEGHLSAVRYLKRFLERGETRVFELRPGGKSLYFAAQLLATALPARLLATSQHCLRSAGVSGNHLHDLLEEMWFETFRAFTNGVRYSFPGARTGASAETWNEYFDALREEHPQVAAVLDDEMTLALKREQLAR